MEENSLYEKLGGEGELAKMIDYFYDQVLKDDTIKNFFSDIDMDRVRSHQTKFISYALGGPNQYTGKEMKEAHEGMNLNPKHFEAFISHFSKALDHFGVEKNDIDEALNKVNSVRENILYQ